MAFILIIIIIFFEYLDYRNKGEIYYNKYDKDFNLIESKLALQALSPVIPHISTWSRIALLPEMTGDKVKQHIFIETTFLLNGKNIN